MDSILYCKVVFRSQNCTSCMMPKPAKSLLLEILNVDGIKNVRVAHCLHPEVKK